MQLLHGIRQRYQARHRARALRNIRECMAFFGYPVDELSDEQIETGVALMGEMASKAGVTTEQATAALKRLGQMTYEAPLQSRGHMC